MCQDTKWDKETVLRPYASFLRLAYETIILRQYIRNLLFDVLVCRQIDFYIKNL